MKELYNTCSGKSASEDYRAFFSVYACLYSNNFIYIKKHRMNHLILKGNQLKKAGLLSRSCQDL